MLMSGLLEHCHQLFYIIYHQAEEKMMFDRDLQDAPYEEQVLLDSKIPLMTLNTLRNTQYFKYPSLPQLSDSFSEGLDMSMDRDIYTNNAKLIRDATVQYLKNCLREYIHDEKIFHQSSIFPLQSFAVSPGQQDNLMSFLVTGNPLLTECQRRDVAKNFAEFEQLVGVFNELKDYFGKQICQELVYIVAGLLEKKSSFFRSLLKKENDGLLPKIQRFWGYENQQELFKGAWQVYEDVDYEQVKKFSCLGVEDIAMSIYFSGKLKYLTLREIKGDLKEGVSVADKFATFITHFSRNLFLSLAGMAQRSEEAFEIASDFSFNCIDENDTFVDSLNKRIKTDQ